MRLIIYSQLIPLLLKQETGSQKEKCCLRKLRLSYKKGQYLQANRKITDAEYLLTESFENATENLEKLFQIISGLEKMG